MRREANYTQAELGQKIGISRETVSAIENERTESIQTIQVDIAEKWYRACALASQKTRNSFIAMVMRYFGVDAIK